ncbi:hypothetical protein [Nocardioides jiangxiensis]|uniref:Zinc-ribbon domain-containing protein n=1 Tax=Nocardioides jiangxiensis TaxID=3064524 RepID=A0ABT9B1A9_9ACTN|nr:hypothetical protein [Nocardioides sp. WY-20]MDO7868463.1 hypothetical protein [Nocardioides sp. WY-20]
MRERSMQAPGGTGRSKRSLVQRGWVVVATHRGPWRAGGPHPWGTAHLKRIGAAQTACGQPAQGWRGFWHLDFRTDVDSPCPACTAVLRAETGDAGGRTDTPSGVRSGIPSGAPEA